MIACPICDSEDSEYLYTTTSREVTNAIKPDNKEIEEEITNIWGGNTCNFMRCMNCDFYFAHPFLAGTPKLYSMIYDRDTYPSWRWEYDIVLDNLEKEDRVLEIGAGKGSFAHSAVEKASQVVCVEPTDSIKGLKRYANIHDVEGKFDVVCSFCCFEHLDNLQAVFKKVYDLTTDKARIYLSVPDKENVIMYNAMLGLNDNPPIHISRWSPGVFKHIKGFKLVDYKRKKVSRFEMLHNIFYYKRKADYHDTKEVTKLFYCFMFALKFLFHKRPYSLYLVKLEKGE